MKKFIIFSAVLGSIMFQSVYAAVEVRPRGHKYYMKHNKHHKAHKLHKPHGNVDATYQN